MQPLGWALRRGRGPQASQTVPSVWGRGTRGPSGELEPASSLQPQASPGPRCLQACVPILAKGREAQVDSRQGHSAEEGKASAGKGGKQARLKFSGEVMVEAGLFQSLSARDRVPRGAWDYPARRSRHQCRVEIRPGNREIQ